MLHLLDAEVSWADELQPVGYRALVRIGDTYIVYADTGAGWHAVTTAMTACQATTWEHHRLDQPCPTGPGLTDWLVEQVTTLVYGAKYATTTLAS